MGPAPAPGTQGKQLHPPCLRPRNAPSRDRDATLLHNYTSERISRTPVPPSSPTVSPSPNPESQGLLQERKLVSHLFSRSNPQLPGIRRTANPGSPSSVSGNPWRCRHGKRVSLHLPREAPLLWSEPPSSPRAPSRNSATRKVLFIGTRCKWEQGTSPTPAHH